LVCYFFSFGGALGYLCACDPPGGGLGGGGVGVWGGLGVFGGGVFFFWVGLFLGGGGWGGFGFVFFFFFVWWGLLSPFFTILLLTPCLLQWPTVSFPPQVSAHSPLLLLNLLEGRFLSFSPFLLQSFLQFFTESSDVFQPTVSVVFFPPVFFDTIHENLLHATPLFRGSFFLFFLNPTRTTALQKTTDDPFCPFSPPPSFWFPPL